MNLWDTRYIDRLTEDLRAENRSAARAFTEAKRAAGLAEPSVRNYLQWLRHWDRFFAKPFEEVQGNDVIRFLTDLRSRTGPRRALAPASVAQAAVRLKMFYAWLGRDEVRPRSFWDSFHVVFSPRRLNLVPITPDEVDKLKRHCRGVRDRAIVSILADAGLRLKELIALRVGSIQFDHESKGAWLVLPTQGRGLKTGPRRIFVLDCVPDLTDHLDEHPLRDDPAAPLWLGSNGHSDGPLQPNAVSLMLRGLRHRAQVRPINAHLFRHSRCTQAARDGWNEARQRLFFGWSAWSRMPFYYTHLNPEILRQQVLLDAKTRAGQENRAAVERLAAALADILRRTMDAAPEAGDPKAPVEDHTTKLTAPYPVRMEHVAPDEP